MNQGNYHENPQKASIRIQSWFRGELDRRKVKLMVKNFFKRRKIIEQLVQTEENYIRDLSIIISDFKMPLIHRNIITILESNIIFANIDAIRQLNQLFFAALFNAFREYWHYKTIFLLVQHQIHFFKLYFEYFNNFTQSMKKIDQISQKSSDFQQFMSQIRIKQKYKMLTLQDYLIKPIQRLPKYVLILKQIKLRTPSDHPDYININNLLILFQEVNESNNQKMNRYILSYKLREIERNLSIPHSITEPGVEFVLEQPVNVLTLDSKTLECNIYLLNTQLIIARRAQGSQIFFMSIPFRSGGGNIVQNQDQYFYKHSFTVQNSEGDSCTFLCNSEEQKQLLIQKIYNQIVKAQQKYFREMSALCSNQEEEQFLRKKDRLNLLTEVQILGTEQRSDTIFKYTVYIIEVRIKNIKQKIFVRFSQIIQLQQFILEKFSNIKIKNILKKTAWLLNHQAQMIELRKISLQKFLKEILNKKQIIQNGKKILLELGLPTDFYLLPEKYKEKNESLRKSVDVYHSQESQNKLKVKKSLGRLNHCISIILGLQQHEVPPRPLVSSHLNSIQQILQANQINLGHYTHFSDRTESYEPEIQQLDLDIYLPWIYNQIGVEKVSLRMTRDQRVGCLIRSLSKKIGLHDYKDFRIYLERQNVCRQLDDHECLPKIVQQIKYGNYRFLFKKMIYVDQDIEELEIRKDRVRLQLITSQVIFQVKKGKYLLNYYELLVISALVAISQVHRGVSLDQIYNKTQFPELADGKLAKQARQMVLNPFIAFFDQSITWEHDFGNKYRHFFINLSKISEENQIFLNKSQAKTLQSEYDRTDLCQLTAMSILMTVRNNVFFGSVTFMVQMSDHLRGILMEREGENVKDRNCWLVIRYDIIFLYTISLSKCLYSFNYNQILKLKPTPSYLIVHFRQREVDYIKLKTTSSYSIRELLNYYKNYGQMVRKIRQDRHFQLQLAELVKEQNHESAFDLSI